METLASSVAREGALEAADAVGWVIRLAKRIEPVHAFGVAHGNLWAECVLVADGSPKSRGLLSNVRRAHSGRAYHSPERSSGGDVSQADDAWAIAVLLYILLTGTLPFLGPSEDEVKRKMAAGAAPLAVFGVDEDELRRVVDAAFARVPATRTARVSTLRRALEAWRPELGLGNLPPLEEEEDEDEQTDESERAIWP